MRGGKKSEASAEITPIKTRRISVCLVGTSPLIMHRFAFKAWQELLLPSPKKNNAERASTLKHDPLAEYQACLYKNRNPKSPTMFHIPFGMVHQSMTAAAIDIPGATRAAMERLTSIVSPDLYIYGEPRIYTCMVRNSDMARTPDVRTRPIFPRWAIPSVEIEYKVDPLSDGQIINLLGAAGVIVGLGDWRPQKGGPFGKFRLAAPDDAELKEILKTESRSAQEKAFSRPVEYDDDTSDILAWFAEETARREIDVPSSGDDRDVSDGKVAAMSRPNGKKRTAASDNRHDGERGI